MPGPTRLSKRVIELTGCSRSEADRYIEGGWVRVDGAVVELPQHMVDREAIEIDPKATLEPLEPVTIVLHKPAGVDVADPRAAVALVTEETHWDDDPSGIRLLRKHRSGLVPVFPLDADASGLLAFTQDPRAQRRFEEEADRFEHEYTVELTAQPRPEAVSRFGKGLEVDGRRIPPSNVSLQSEQRLRFALKGVSAGQIRRMCTQVGFGVVSVKRVRVGRISLGKTPVGKWRYLASQQRF